MGVGKEDGMLRFSNVSENCLNHVLTAEEKVNTPCIEIPTTTLNNAFKDQTPSIMKIDIEGFEWFALQGADKLLHSSTLHAIILEFNEHAKRYGITSDMMEKKLLEFGFRPYAYSPEKRTLCKTTFNTNGNTLWVRHEDIVREAVTSSPVFSVYGHCL